ncbi:hypothetical protein [Gelatiniphilus marinus]|uniref:Uncharacterized protein n=1 Tax=Gelatiniphilus marinus TaxID=1759464 RepID=A0ABW5JQQ2_9FLAO
MSDSKNNYLDFITDAHFLQCISNLHQSYLEAKKEFTKSKY